MWTAMDIPASLKVMSLFMLEKNKRVHGMAYGLFVGKSTQLKDMPILLASIGLDEHPLLLRLAKRGCK
jgi:hypothetical protein